MTWIMNWCGGLGRVEAVNKLAKGEQLKKQIGKKLHLKKTKLANASQVGNMVQKVGY